MAEPPGEGVAATQGGGRPLSFAQALSASLRPKTVPLVRKLPAFTDDGRPATFFSRDEVRRSEEPLRWGIVARCSYGRPSIPDTKSCLSQRLALKSNFVLSNLNHRHVLMRFEEEEDFIKVLVRKNLYIKGYLFRFFRWSKNFDFEADPSLIPIWVGFPNLPVNFYNEDYLRSIAGNIGSVLRIHDATLAWTQTAEALVCVDVDILKPLWESIWIGDGDDGFWQKINYHRVPDICSLCKRIGHKLESCKKNPKDRVQQEAPKPKELVKDLSREVGEWRPVQRGRRVQGREEGLEIPVHNAFQRLNDDLQVGPSNSEEVEAIQSVPEVVKEAPVAHDSVQSVAQDSMEFVAGAVSEAQETAVFSDDHVEKINQSDLEKKQFNVVLDESEGLQAHADQDYTGSVADLEGGRSTSEKCTSPKQHFSNLLPKKGRRFDGGSTSNLTDSPISLTIPTVDGKSIKASCGPNLEAHAHMESGAKHSSSHGKNNQPQDGLGQKWQAGDVNVRAPCSHEGRRVPDVGNGQSRQAGVGEPATADTVQYRCINEEASSSDLMDCPTPLTIQADQGAEKEDVAPVVSEAVQGSTYKGMLQSPHSSAGQVDKNISSSSSGSRKMISRPSRKGGVRICMPVPRARSPSPPPPAATNTPKFNMEAARSVLEQSKAENIFMPGFTFSSEESDNHDDDALDYDYNERCRRRPGLRPRGVLRRSHSWDDFSLEF